GLTQALVEPRDESNRVSFGHPTPELAGHLVSLVQQTSVLEERTVQLLLVVFTERREVPRCAQARLRKGAKHETLALGHPRFIRQPAQAICACLQHPPSLFEHLPQGLECLALGLLFFKVHVSVFRVSSLGELGMVLCKARAGQTTPLPGEPYTVANRPGSR